MQNNIAQSIDMMLEREAKNMEKRPLMNEGKCLDSINPYLTTSSISFKVEAKVKILNLEEMLMLVI